jgi:hypothetical protein
LHFCHDRSLELQTGFTRGFCQRLHAAVITETGTVEGDFGDTGFECFLCYALADQCGGSGVAAIARLASQFARTSASTVEAEASTLASGRSGSRKCAGWCGAPTGGSL